MNQYVMMIRGVLVEKKQVLLQALKRLNDFLVKEMKLASDEGLFIILKGLSSRDDVVMIGSSLLALEYTVVLQAWAPQKDIGVLVTQVKSLPSTAILFADFINPVMAEKFRQRS
ncbi:MAG: hypothetical protein GQ550_00410, partial [Gammaproteobacteria bacterium]|nr:hypothetical protein [Gammaproteobacteria bacterium]